MYGAEFVRKEPLIGGFFAFETLVKGTRAITRQVRTRRGKNGGERPFKVAVTSREKAGTPSEAERVKAQVTRAGFK